MAEIETNDFNEEEDPESGRVPSIVSKIRSFNIGLGVMIYENHLSLDDLHWFSTAELYEISVRTFRPELASEASRLSGRLCA